MVPRSNSACTLSPFGFELFAEQQALFDFTLLHGDPKPLDSRFGQAQNSLFGGKLKRGSKVLCLGRWKGVGRDLLVFQQ